MKLSEVIALALHAVWAHKLRSFLTLLGVIFGVATTIVVVSLVEGFNTYVDEKIADLGRNAFRVQKHGIDDFASVDSYVRATRRNADIRMDDVEAIRLLAPLVDQISVRAMSIGEIERGTARMSSVRVQGASPNALEIDRTDIEAGRFFSEQEDSHNRAVAFIGWDVAERCFPGADPVGRSITIDGRPYIVIGVARQLGSVFGQPRDAFVYIPISTFLKSYGSRRSLFVLATSAEDSQFGAAIDQARVALRIHRHLRPDEPDTFGIITPGAVNNLRDKIFGTIQLTAIGVTSIALVVGGIVIMNIMLVSVTERTREIGIRKAVGARRRDILEQFLVESTLMAALGGVLGTALAYGVATAVSTFTPLPTSLPVAWTVVAILVSASVGLVAGVYPAYRAGGLDPIAALREE